MKKLNGIGRARFRNHVERLIPFKYERVRKMMIGFQYFERSLKRTIFAQFDHGDHGLGIAVRIIFKVNKVLAVESDRKWIGPKVALRGDQVLELIERIIEVLYVSSERIG